MFGPAGLLTLTLFFHAAQAATSSITGAPVPTKPVNFTTSTASPAPSGGVNFVIRNQHPTNLSLYYASGFGFNPLAAPQNLGTNSTQTATFPPGWQGNIQVVEANSGGLFQQSSWMEGNTLDGQVWMDVSYVRGYSVSIVCQCKQSDGSERISGCNKDLWADDCPNKGAQPNVTCPNTSGDNKAEGWFKACNHLAYTYANDIPNFECAPGEPVDCCIGTSCPRPPNPPGVAENLSAIVSPSIWALLLTVIFSATLEVLR